MEVPSNLFARFFGANIKSNFTKIGGRRVPYYPIQRFHDFTWWYYVSSKSNWLWVGIFVFLISKYTNTNGQLWNHHALGEETKPTARLQVMTLFGMTQLHEKHLRGNPVISQELKHLCHQQKTIESQPMKILFCTRSQSQNWWCIIKWIPSLNI